MRFPLDGEEAAEISQGFKFEQPPALPAAREAGGGSHTYGKPKKVTNNEDAVHRIDQQLAESHDLLAALIFISENVEDHQHELLAHSAISLCYTVLDKLAAANRDVSLLLRLAA